MWLEVRTGPDAGAAVELPADAPFVLGRQQGCDLIVRDTRASRRHAELRGLPGGGVRLRDLGSANGTLVDGRRVEEALLEGGEDIVIGDVVIGVLRADPARPSEVREPEPAPVTASMIRRLVQQSTRRAHRSALAAGAVALVAVIAAGVLVPTGGLSGDDDRVPRVVASVAPSTVLVQTSRDGTPTGSGSGWVLDAG